ncbi:hypothetical protein ACJMK2_000845, partial [Sinanodonta woodiana]
TRSSVITIYKMDYLHQTGVPIEILKMDDRSIQLFKEALKDGKETVHSIRIMVVGHLCVGKTTLIKRLLGEEVNISERHPTEGIDVHVNCCDVSLSTHEWTRRIKDSDQDYKLQRTVRVINENYQPGRREVDSEHGAGSDQKKTANGNTLSLTSDDDNNAEVIDLRSQPQNIVQNISSTTSLQNESSSAVVQESLPQSATNTIPGSDLGENAATEKIDVIRDMLKLLQQNPNKAKQHISKHAHLTILDFAGHTAFYTTHQMFLTRRAIYLLVSNASQEVNDLVEDDCYFDADFRLERKVQDLVQVWMNSIHLCALPDEENLNSSNSPTLSCKVLPPPVILVGTHIDQIPQDYRRERGQRYLKEIRSCLSDKPSAVHLVDEDFAIDNTILDSKLEELKKKIVEVASQQSYWGEKIPTTWFLLEQQLTRLRDDGVKIVSHSTVEKLNREGAVKIEESEELDLFLRYLHETGIVIYFSIELLRDNILLDPKWMIDALKLLINVQPNLPNNPAENDTESNNPADNVARINLTQKLSDFKEKGILAVELVDAIWTKENHSKLQEHKEHMLMIMVQLNILAKPRSFNEMGEKGHDPGAPITPEHMNYARVGVALITVCGNALRKILQSNFPVPYADIYQVILVNRHKLTQRPGRPLLNRDQILLLFPDPHGNEVGKLDQFDISLLYILIRNISTVPEPITGWNMDPCDHPRDASLGASVERIRSYRNRITGHSADGMISGQTLEEYWDKFEAVICDIEAELGTPVCSQQLEKQRRQVISIYEAC